MESENLLVSIRVIRQVLLVFLQRDWVWERLIIYFKGNHLLCYVRRNLIENARKRTREKRHLGKRQLNTRKSNVDILWSIHSHSKWARIFLQIRGSKQLQSFKFCGNSAGRCYCLRVSLDTSYKNVCHLLKAMVFCRIQLLFCFHFLRFSPTHELTLVFITITYHNSRRAK